MTQIEQVAIDKLIPYINNARTHSQQQVAQVAASIREFGFTNPVLIDKDNGIIAGHGRVMAAQQLEMTEVPCIRLGHLTEVQKRAYILADNKLALNAGWDEELLAFELAHLKDAGFDFELTGFESGEIDELLASLNATPEGEIDPDEVPEVQAEAVSKPGDVWVLGKHRIMCGDSTVTTDVAKLLDGALPHLMVTDPPYGVEYKPRTSNPLKAGKVLNDDRADWREAWALFPGNVAYVWHASMFSHVVIDSLMACGFEHRAMIVWSKDRFTLGRGNYHWQHEPCWYCVKKGKTAHWVGGRKQSTVWDIPAREDNGHGHGTQKPVECMKRPIRNNSKAGDSIYEPFSGSGTTIIAAEQTGRRCYAMELSPQYVDVAVRRWQQFTGKAATLEATGQPFPPSAGQQ